MYTAPSLRLKALNNTSKFNTYTYVQIMFIIKTPQWGAADAEIKVPSDERTQSLRVLPLIPGIGQYIAIHATLTAREFFLAYFYPSSPFTCIFSKTSPDFFLLAAANTGSCVGPQNEIGHPAGCRFPC